MSHSYIRQDAYRTAHTVENVHLLFAIAFICSFGGVGGIELSSDRDTPTL